MDPAKLMDLLTTLFLGETSNTMSMRVWRDEPGGVLRYFITNAPPRQRNKQYSQSQNVSSAGLNIPYPGPSMTVPTPTPQPTSPQVHAPPPTRSKRRRKATSPQSAFSPEQIREIPNEPSSALNISTFSDDREEPNCLNSSTPAAQDMDALDQTFNSNIPCSNRFQVFCDKTTTTCVNINDDKGHEAESANRRCCKCRPGWFCVKCA